MAYRLEENPPITFPDHVLESEQNGELWWVAHTKSRREKVLAKLLLREGIGYFLPLVRKRFRRHGRTRISIVPLFSGYVFLKGSRIDRYRALRTDHVASTIEVFDQDRLTSELRQIKAALCLDAPLELFPFVEGGKRVRIVEGPFTGLEGMVQRRKGADRLILSVEAIQQAVSLEIDADWVEPVS